MLATIRKWVLITLLVAVAGFLLYRWFEFRLARELLPAGTAIAGVDVSGLTFEQAASKLERSYNAPVYLYHREDHVELNPKDVGFSLDMEAMSTELRQTLAQQNGWLSFASFVFDRPLLQSVDIPLQASHDAAALQAMLDSVSEFLDRPAQPAQLLSRGEVMTDGVGGYITDLEASFPLAEEALYSPQDRVVHLALIEEDASEVNMELLAEVIEAKLASFDGFGSIFVKDLQTGEEVNINADVAVSGLSILKIAIFVEAYRALDQPPDSYQQQLFIDTATRSSNYGANLLLHVVAGENNTYKGADILTESMRLLGLANTFIAVPYDASAPAHRQNTYVTPANSVGDLPTELDSSMQTTAEEVGTLLTMIYECSKGGGALLAAYSDSLTPTECQEIIDLMTLNEEGNLIRFGVPEGTRVSHKHGWARATHADAGIVFTPGGDFVLVEYLSQPGDWLVADESFPILREIPRIVYNYFNPDAPFLVDVLDSRSQIDTDDPFSEIHGDESPAEATEETQPDSSGTAAGESSTG
jgi:beta-lactamase class A